MPIYAVYLGLFSKIRAVVELPAVGFFLTERNFGLTFGVIDEGLSPRDLRLLSPVGREDSRTDVRDNSFIMINTII